MGEVERFCTKDSSIINNNNQSVSLILKSIEFPQFITIKNSKQMAPRAKIGRRPCNCTCTCRKCDKNKPKRFSRKLICKIQRKEIDELRELQVNTGYALRKTLNELDDAKRESAYHAFHAQQYMQEL